MSIENRLMANPPVSIQVDIRVISFVFYLFFAFFFFFTLNYYGPASRLPGVVNGIWQDQWKKDKNKTKQNNKKKKKKKAGGIARLD